MHSKDNRKNSENEKCSFLFNLSFKRITFYELINFSSFLFKAFAVITWAFRARFS